ncbi:hypothetical protein LUZ60_005326 [Juncus effusus]|nr:hypothetical protein LUZ60_005326 [Juncus effusus]
MESTSLADKNKALKILKAADSGDLRLLISTAKKLDRGRGLATTIASCRHGNLDGLGALHIASSTGRTNVCRYLIDKLGFDPNSVPSNGKTPIFHAVFSGNVETLNYLLDKGANPSVRDSDGFTPVHSAVLEGNAEMLKILLERGGPVGAKVFAGTPLVLATCRGDDSCVKVLLDHHADPNEANTGFLTPLGISVIINSMKSVELLIKAGADLNNVNSVTLLELALDSIEMMNYLLKAGADPNIPNEYGRYPIEIAAKCGKKEAVETLFPLTNKIPTVSDWSIEGLFRHVQAAIFKIEEEVQSKKRLESLKLKADRALTRKEYIVSIFLWSYALMESPMDANLYANRCLCWLKMGVGIKALFDANICRNLRPDWPISYLRLGSAFSLMKEYEQAAITLMYGLSLDPTNREIQKVLKETMELKERD